MASVFFSIGRGGGYHGGYHPYYGGGWGHRNYVGGSLFINTSGHHDGDRDDGNRGREEEGRDRSHDEQGHLQFEVDRCLSKPTHHWFHDNFPKVRVPDAADAIKVAFESTHGDPQRMAEFKHAWMRFSHEPQTGARDKRIADAMDALTVRWGGKVEYNQPQQTQTRDNNEDKTKDAAPDNKPQHPVQNVSPQDAAKDIVTQTKGIFKASDDNSKPISASLNAIIKDMRNAGLSAEEVQPLREKLATLTYNKDVASIIGDDVVRFQADRGQMSLHEALEHLNEALIEDIKDLPNGSNIPNYRETRDKVIALK